MFRAFVIINNVAKCLLVTHSQLILIVVLGVKTQFLTLHDELV